jgi:hypothetical protein
VTYLRRHGKPVAFYSDKHSIFRVYKEGATGRTGGVQPQEPDGKTIADRRQGTTCDNLSH